MTSNNEFNAITTGDEVCAAYAESIRDRVFLITGCSPNGLGFMTAKSILSKSPKLMIISGRSEEKMNKSRKELEELFPEASIRILLMDLSSPSSVRKAAAEVNSYKENIDVLINNAGIMAVETLQLDEFVGVESQLGTNHVGHFLFTNLIMEKLVASANANNNKSGMTRIINLSSLGHEFGPFRFDDYNFEKKFDGTRMPFKYKSGKEPDERYDPMAAYAQSKTANILFTVSLQKRLSDKGIVSYAVHPGSIITELGKNLDEEWLQELVKSRTMKTLEQGVSSTCVAALDPGLCKIKGIYISDCQFKEAKEWATDETNAKKLWKLSEDIVKEKFLE
ncbi:hypothetical protein V1511DRAFT_464461 [Dipodascopsis uninucleata]